MPTFTSNRPDPAAAAITAARTILPTTLGTAELARIPVELRNAAVFSAGVSQAEILQHIHDRVSQVIAGTATSDRGYVDRGVIQTELAQLLQAIGYQPDDPRKEGTIQDLRTNARINLIIDTQFAMARGYGAMKRRTTSANLLVFPCDEFLRLSPRQVPRGYKIKAGALVSENPRYWQDRWLRAGGQIYGGRMIARVDDLVWVKLSRFGNPWDPVDFNTGYGREPIGRSEAIRLGVITRGDLVAAPVAQVSPEVAAASTPEPASAGSPALYPTGSPPPTFAPQANASLFFPALRAALASALRGLFRLDANDVLVPV